MGSGVSRVATGSVIGTGVALPVNTVGFTPRKVELFNTSDLVAGEWSDTMASGTVVKRITNGTLTFEAADGVTPTAAGFTLGTDADLNAANEVVHWVAYE